VKSFIFFIFCYLLPESNLLAQQEPSRFKDRIDSIAQAMMWQVGIPGLSIGLIINNKPYYIKGYGTRKMRDELPVDSVTNFHTASVSKLFVGTAIMKLASQKKLGLDDKIVNYFPGVKVKDKRTESVTIRQMLNHTSGIKDVLNYHWEKPDLDTLALKCFGERSIKKKKLLFDPGTDLKYSNRAYEMLGRVIEVASGMSFERYMRDSILIPSGMNYSDYDYYRIDEKRRTTGHIRKLYHHRVVTSATYPFNKSHMPSSTLNSCTQDLMKWCGYLLDLHHDSLDETRKPISGKILKQMWTPTFRGKPNEQCGITWWIERSPKLGMCYSHDGGDLGFSSDVLLLPQIGFAYVALANLDDEKHVVYGRLLWEILKIMYPDWKPGE
jgi:CubicO group peptidase (beta-lactamase class C family)